MPYFTPFVSNKLESLYQYLNQNYQVLGPVQTAPKPVSDAAKNQAQSTFAVTCSTCHGIDGRGKTALSAGFAPAPPDFNNYSLESQTMFDIITNGYPGTMMAAHSDLPDDVRWGLVSIVQDFYQPFMAE
jgi:mono/diheme cytochrome c family protein